MRATQSYRHRDFAVTIRANSIPNSRTASDGFGWPMPESIADIFYFKDLSTSRIIVTTNVSTQVHLLDDFGRILVSTLPLLCLQTNDMTGYCRQYRINPAAGA